MNTVMLLMFVQINGASYPQTSEYFESMSQCEQRSEVFVNRVDALNCLQLPLKAVAYCVEKPPMYFINQARK